jgi:HD superfamily phosphohydrolase
MTDSLSHIPELSNLTAGGGLIRVPMEINVPFTPRVRAIVDTAEFQRLAQISQLGLVARVYPGARHTRFEHALGVYHNALCYLQQLQKDARFRETINRPAAELLIVAALLHDLGHWPFCHPIEDLEIPGLRDHESYASRFLGAGSELAEVLRTHWDIAPADVLNLLAGRTNSPEMKLLRSILSGPIDVDKMDYLDRDSLHCGVPYGRNFDRQRLIQSLVLNEAGDGLAISYKGKTAAELMVFARYVMFSEVYWHHAVRAATSLFAHSFFALQEHIDLEHLFERTEAEMIAEVRTAARGTDCEQLLEGVFGARRRLYKRVAEYSFDDASAIYERLAGRPFADLVRCGARLTQLIRDREGIRLGPVDLLIDGPPPHREVEFDIDVFFPQRSEYRRLRDVSPVVDALARTQFDESVKRVRIFGSPDFAPALRQLTNLDAFVADAISATNNRD